MITENEQKPKLALGEGSGIRRFVLIKSIISLKQSFELLSNYFK